MSLTYAIPDLHGRVDLLQQALSRIVEHSQGQLACVVTLGDYVDRGPSSRQILELLMDWRFPRLQLVALKGNHEAMMWQVCNNLAEQGWWLDNGGDATLKSYGKAAPAVARDVIPAHHLEWIGSLPSVYADANRVFVHAGVDPSISLAQQSDQTLLWKRYPAGFSQGHGTRHVVHGHHAHEHGPIVTKGKTNLDAMAWKTGRLVVGVFCDKRPGGAIEFLEVLAPSV